MQGFFNDTFIKSFLLFFFPVNYCVIVSKNNFSQYCGWLRFATQLKLLFFTLGTQTSVLPIIIIIITSSLPPFSLPCMAWHVWLTEIVETVLCFRKSRINKNGAKWNLSFVTINRTLILTEGPRQPRLKRFWSTNVQLIEKKKEKPFKTLAKIWLAASLAHCDIQQFYFIFSLLLLFFKRPYDQKINSHNFFFRFQNYVN